MREIQVNNGVKRPQITHVFHNRVIESKSSKVNSISYTDYGLSHKPIGYLLGSAFWAFLVSHSNMYQYYE